MRQNTARRAGHGKIASLSGASMASLSLDVPAVGAQARRPGSMASPSSVEPIDFFMPARLLSAEHEVIFRLEIVIFHFGLQKTQAAQTPWPALLIIKG